MKRPDTYNILFCGVGGQGVLKAAEVLGWAAVFAGYHVKKTEVHGMSQRGGSVESHVRFGPQVYSPLVPRGKADFLVAFHEDEGIRLKDFLKPRGVTLSPRFHTTEPHIKDERRLNTYFLGLLSLRLPLKEEHWLKALEVVFAGKDLAENKKIFFAGAHLALSDRQVRHLL